MRDLLAARLVDVLHESTMTGSLAGKTAVVYGGGGAVGGAAARGFARNGAHVCLAGRAATKLESVADSIRVAGGSVDVSVVDALDRNAVTNHLEGVQARAGSVDVLLNAVGITHVQGTSFVELALEEFHAPIRSYLDAQFILASAAAPYMIEQRSGVLLMLSTPGSRLPGAGYLGFGVTCAAIEALSRLLAAELGEHGVRTVCLRSEALPEAVARDSHATAVFAPMAAKAGLSVDDFVASAAGRTLLGRLPTLEQIAEAAVFAASDAGGALTGAIMNLTCGTLVD